MFKSQRVNALQKSKAAEVDTYLLATYLDDIGVDANLRYKANNALALLREITRTLAQTSAVDEESK